MFFSSQAELLKFLSNPLCPLYDQSGNGNYAVDWTIDDVLRLYVESKAGRHCMSHVQTLVKNKMKIETVEDLIAMVARLAGRMEPAKIAFQPQAPVRSCFYFRTPCVFLNQVFA